ncbi:MAG: hypothetical protein H6R00_1405 [Proteobacteria bacterium]|nr:hypothetical protein [Pseudomonadota bacterium]
MKLSDAKMGTLSQGTIFTCAKAERYCDQVVYGLVITARCDIAQEKFPVLNYVPVVTLDDWLMVDGLDLIRERAEKESYGKLKGFLKAHDVAESILISQTLRDLSSSIFSGLKEKEKQQFESIITQIELSTTGCIPNISKFFEEFERTKVSLIEDLIHHKVTGYYFLPGVYTSDPKRGFVVLLREASFVPRDIAPLIANGADLATLKTSKTPNAVNCLNFSIDDFAMPISQIPSPEIEHILQSFSMMFGRIGLADPDPLLISELRNRIPEKARAAR